MKKWYLGVNNRYVFFNNKYFFLLLLIMFNKHLNIFSQLTADNEHWFEVSSPAVSHVRVVMAPDGGISRIRLIGNAAPLIQRASTSSALSL